MVARDILDSTHPLNPIFLHWVGDNPPTLRKARKFLALHPQYRVVQEG